MRLYGVKLLGVKQVERQRRKKELARVCGEKVGYVSVDMSINSRLMTWTGSKVRGGTVDGGGHRVCEHNRRKTLCAECGGNSLCQHRKQKYTCRECKGPSLCEHLRQRSKCKDCGGVGTCQHNNDKSRCKLCNLAHQ